MLFRSPSLVFTCMFRLSECPWLSWEISRNTLNLDKLSMNPRQRILSLSIYAPNSSRGPPLRCHKPRLTVSAHESSKHPETKRHAGLPIICMNFQSGAPPYIRILPIMLLSVRVCSHTHLHGRGRSGATSGAQRRESRR